jgi:hypothetical protein
MTTAHVMVIVIARKNPSDSVKLGLLHLERLYTSLESSNRLDDYLDHNLDSRNGGGLANMNHHMNKTQESSQVPAQICYSSNNRNCAHDSYDNDTITRLLSSFSLVVN